MFWDNFLKLCEKANKSPNAVGADLGYSSGSITAWKQGRVPKWATISKISDYFGVSTDYLLGNTDQKEKTTNLEEKGRQAEFVDLFSRLTPEQQKMLMAQMKGLLSE